MLPFSLALAAVPLLASIAQAAPASGVVLKREALVQSIEADLRTRGWTDDRVNELEVEALKADILTLAAEKRLFGWGEDDSSDEGYAPVKTTCEANTNFVRAADSCVNQGLMSRSIKQADHRRTCRMPPRPAQPQRRREGSHSDPAQSKPLPDVPFVHQRRPVGAQPQPDLEFVDQLDA